MTMAPRTSSASSSTQRGRRRRGEPEPEEEEDEVNVTSEEEAAQTQSVGGLTEEDLKKKAAKLMRFAFAMERLKRPLKRGEMSKLLNNPRHFAPAMERAQQILKKTFGMELVELRQKYKIGDELEADVQEQATQAEATQKKKGKGRRMQDIEEEDEDDEDEEEAMPKQKKAKPKGSGFYMLRSTLPPALLQEMANPKAFPLPREANDTSDPDHGALIDWENGDSTQSGHIAMLGIRTIILCLVMSNNRVMPDDQLHAFLRRLSIDRDTPLPYTAKTSASNPNVNLTLDKYLDLLDRQLYLQKVKIPTPGAAESHTVEWRWGQRQAEFSEVAAAKFIEEIMFHGRDEEEEERRPAGRGKRAAQPDDGVASVKEQRKRMRKNLERAVGGNLQGEL